MLREVTSERLTDTATDGGSGQNLVVVDDPAGLVLAIDADCPACGGPERTFTAATGLYGCTRCTHVSPERDH
ncbi:hypothetical protein DL990_20125 [Amycolatopsis sp. WAC 01416]|uniref:hypothetical protein n=1 Tax=Amycolatopsis sp. WAC 01416 TaxID=2203196 RepID=UPI000F7AF7B2|nr:hypothetical protein [Amycolatopsis sp. WAC 01416]RSN32227.1 hypothetical protein DL990_20125 [Amycolatopsis sp. WAC 01416]